MNTAIIEATTIITLVMLTAIGISGVLISTPLHASNGGNVVSVSQSSNSINGGNGGGSYQGNHLHCRNGVCG